MGRLIEADRLKEVFSRNIVGGNAYFDLIDMQPTVEAVPKDNVYKAIQEMMEYEHERSINISLARLNEILEKCGVWGCMKIGMTNNNLCNSCTNIGCEFQSDIVRTECAFYMPPHLGPDSCGNFVVMQPTVEATPKAQYDELKANITMMRLDYEARLKADMMAMLEDLDLQIDESAAYNLEVAKVQRLIRDRINSLKENTDGNDY